MTKEQAQKEILLCQEKFISTMNDIYFNIFQFLSIFLVIAFYHLMIYVTYIYFNTWFSWSLLIVSLHLAFFTANQYLPNFLSFCFKKFLNHKFNILAQKHIKEIFGENEYRLFKNTDNIIIFKSKKISQRSILKN